ncbi:MAG: PKD domain-containing protein [Saprospiraceae bacterium]
MQTNDPIYYKIFLLLLFFLLVHNNVFTQTPSYTANDQVTPYEGPFQFGTNMGYYPGWTDGQLGDLAIGNGTLNIPGIGATALRPGLFEHYLEQYGYDINLPWFEHFDSLGLVDNTMFVGDPSEDHRDPTDYCPSKPWLKNMGFKNMYEPIWDNGANGTPVNDENYYALFMYKMVTMYTPYVKFWEITNEPDLDFSDQGMGWREPGDPVGSWWDNNPEPCDYQFAAPIFHYNRMLRISYEIIKSIDPDDYVTVGGLGFPSFLDAMMRNTDNPIDGSVTAEYPLKGGAYFDVLSFHSYPHINGSLRIWDPINGTTGYKRHSDAAIEGITEDLNEFKLVMKNYGYDGDTFPEKLAIMTESSIPRKKFGDYIGSDEAARNYAVKLPIELQKEGVLNFHYYDLGEKETFTNALYPFQMTGFYEKLEGTAVGDIQRTNSGIAYKTVSNLLFEKTYDDAQTTAMQLPANVDGGAFKHANGQYTYVLWAICETDDTETSAANYSFPANLNLTNLKIHNWDFSLTNQQTISGFENIPLTGSPQFFTPTNQQISFNCPSDINLTLPYTSTGQVVTWDPISANSLCSTGTVNVEQTGGLTSGSFFPIGTSTITYLISDDCGNSETCNFNVILELDTSPGVDCPSNTHLVTITIIGNGSVDIEFIDPVGMTETCTEGICSYCINTNSLIKLVGLPDASETFIGWSGGGCAGNDVCWKGINWETHITATFSENTSNPIELTTTSTDVTCNGENDGSAQVNAAGGTSNYSYHWSDGQTTSQLNNASAGNYVVTVTDATGTTAIASVQINQPATPLFGFILNQTNVTCLGGDDGSTEINVSGGTSPYQYSWSNNNSNPTLNNLLAGTYIVTITDNNGCTSSTSTTILEGNLIATTSDFSKTINGFSIDFEDLSTGNPTTWMWDFGDGNTSTTISPSHTYSAAGNYLACLTVSNDCGQNTSCQNISLGQINNILIDLESVNGNTGSIVQVPIRVENFNNVVSFQHSFKIPDTTMAEFVGTSNFVSTQLGNTATFNVTPENINTVWLSASGTSASLIDGTILYYLDILVKGLPGDCIEIELDNQTLPTEFVVMVNGNVMQVGYDFNSAEVCSSPGVIISGNIQTEFGTPIQDVEMFNAAGTNTFTGTTNLNGNYATIPFPMGSSLSIEPHKDVNYVNGVTSFDLATIQQHIVGNEILDSPYKLIAADIDHSNSISSFDLFLAQQVIVANVDTFPNNESWRFVPADFVFPDPTNPLGNPFPEAIDLTNVTSNITNQDFIAIKVGDVNGTALPNFTGGGTSGVTRSSGGELTFFLRKEKTSENEFYIEFLAKDFKQISAFQFDLFFEKSKMQLVEIKEKQLNVKHGNKLLDDGIITLIWFDAASEGKTLEGKSSLFKIYFKGKMEEVSLANDVQLVEKITPAIAYSYLGIPQDLTISILEKIGIGHFNQSILVFQNQPNPFSKSTRILFEMMKEEKVQVKIIDQNGKVFFELEEIFSKGIHHLDFNGNDFSSAGIYYYTFTTSTDRIVKKMILGKVKE